MPFTHWALVHPPPQLMDNGDGMVLGGDGQVADVEPYDFNLASNFEQSEDITNQQTFTATPVSIAAPIPLNNKFSILKIKLILYFFFE